MIAGLVPIKSPSRAKSRLAEAFSAEAHAEITAALLEDALDLCSESQGVRWWVVSDDEGVRRSASDRGLDTLADTGEGLNGAIRLGIEAALAHEAESVIVIPGDVPLAQPEDVHDILDTGDLSDVVVVPASDGGTNGLYLSLPTELEPGFGPESLRLHLEGAQELGLRCSILDLPRLSLDLDTEEDARKILEVGATESRTLDVLRRVLA